MAGTTNDQNKSTTNNRSPETISIWQQNVNKSSTCQHNLISSAALARRGIDIVALQEPAISKFGTSVASREWVPIYPTTHNAAPHNTRSLLLIRSNILTEQWKQVDYPSGDITIVQLSGSWGELTLYNIYNDCEKNDTVTQLEVFTHRFITSGRNSESAKPILWLGDFNRHHPHWDNPTDTRLFTRTALDNAEILISAVASLGLDLALPPGIPTHLHNVTKKWTRLDQVFITEEHIESVITCDALSNTPGINTDHLPILTTLDLNLARSPTTPPRNFRNVDWDVFEKALVEKLDKTNPPRCIQRPSDLKSACLKLTESIQETINEEVPTTEIRIKAKKWWTKELTKLRQEANRKGRRASKYKDWPDHQSHTERKDANRLFHKTLEHTKRQHWRDWLEKAEDPDIWTAHKYTSSPAGDGGKSRIPVLKVISNGQEDAATTNEEKSKLLAKTFFPPRPQDDTPIHFAYPKPICDFDPISREQIRRQLKKLKPYKAPGPDGIPNIVLTKCANALVDRLYYIYRAILELEEYYEPWRTSITVVLRKPGKPRYDIPKAYRPIALLNTMSKVLTALMANLMSFYTETHQLLPAHHFGGRPGRTTTDAVHLLVHKIKDAWRKRQVTSTFPGHRRRIPERGHHKASAQHEEERATG